MNSKIFKKISIQMLILLLITASISFFAISQAFAMGVLIGGVVAILNFILLLFTVKKIFFGEPKTQIIYAILFMFKLAAIGGLIFWLFMANLFNFSKAGFLVGITILFITLILHSFMESNKLKSEVN